MTKIFKNNEQPDKQIGLHNERYTLRALCSSLQNKHTLLFTEGLRGFRKGLKIAWES